MLVDFENDSDVEPKFAQQPKSPLPAPSRYTSNKINLDELCDVVTERLYRCDIAHVWLGDCKVFVDVAVPKFSDPDYPYGSNNCLTFHPGFIPGNGRQQYIRYLLKTWILHDLDGIITNLADDLLFDPHRYGKCDLSERISHDWRLRLGRNVNTFCRTVKAEEMPARCQLKWAKTIIEKHIIHAR